MDSVLLLSTLLIVYVSMVKCNGLTEKDIVEDRTDGDILIGYMDLFRSTDKSIQNLLSFQAAVTNESFWPNVSSVKVKVGYVVVKVDMETDESHVNVVMETLRRYPKIVAFLGFISNSSDVIQTASFINAVKIPTFTCASSIKIDELLKVANHEYMTRITSNRSVQMSGTIPSILDELGANIVSIFFDRVKELEFSKLNQWLHDHREKRVDVEYHKLLEGEHPAEYMQKILDHVSGKDGTYDWGRIRTVIFLVAGSRLEKILTDIANQSVEPLQKVVFVTDSSGCRFTETFSRTLEKLTDRNVVILRLCQTAFDAQEATDYIGDYKLYTRHDGGFNNSNKVIDDWYRNRKNKKPCILGENADCKSVGELCLENPPSSRYNHRIYYTTRKVLKSLDNMTADQVEEIRQRSIDDILVNTSSVGHLIYEGFKKNNVDLPDGSTFLRYDNDTMVNYYEVQFNGALKGNKSGKTTVWTSGKDNTKFENFMKDIKSEIISSSDQYLSCSRQCEPGRGVQ